MTYQVLARKHRPQTFDDLFGQEAVAQTLQNALESKKLAHAYLFFGPRGTGKTTTARILAKALNCAKGPTPRPCLKCDACTEIAANRAIDVLEIDAATHTQVDKVREVIIETVATAPVRDRYKIFIIDEAHMLSTSAFNALLKTLEEPPAHVVFMLATTEQHKVPATIFSRCQRYRFRLQSVPVIVEYLKKVADLEKLKAEPKALEIIARAAEGSMRDAVSLLDQAAAFASGPLKETVARELLGQLPEVRLQEIAKAVLARDAQALGAAFSAALEEGQDPGALLRELRGIFHQMFSYKSGLSQVDKPWAAIADGVEVPALAFVLRRLAKGVDDLRGTDQVRLQTELTLFGLMEAPHDLREWVTRLEALEKRTGESAPPPIHGRGPGGEPVPLSPPVSRAPAQAAAPVTKASSPVSTPEKALPPAPSREREGGNLKPEGWARVVGAVVAQRPALGRYLASAQFEWRDGGVLLSFVSNFAMESVRKELAFIAQAMASLTGIQAPIEVRQDRDATPAPTVAADAADDEPGQEAKPGKYKAVTGDDPVKSDPGVQKALKAFQGKLYKPKT